MGTAGVVEAGAVVGEDFGVAADGGQRVADLVAEHADDVELELVGHLEFGVAVSERGRSALIRRDR
jgi:hypothetical protein